MKVFAWRLIGFLALLFQISSTSAQRIIFRLSLTWVKLVRDSSLWPALEVLRKELEFLFLCYSGLRSLGFDIFIPSLSLESIHSWVMDFSSRWKDVEFSNCYSCSSI